MATERVVAVFDVGKTNKKLLLFNEDYHIVYERSARFTEVEDEDGFPCENLPSLRQSVLESVGELLEDERFEVAAVQFASSSNQYSILNASWRGSEV